jgi:ferredoxin
MSVLRGDIARGLCESNAVCVALAPDVFDLDRDGIAYPIADELDAAQADEVRNAVEGCPRRAVLLLGEEG